MRTFSGFIQSTLLCFMASQAWAEDVYLEFHGKMTLNDFSTTDFFDRKGQQPAEGPFAVSGLLVVDNDEPPRNISATPDQRLMYNAGVFPGRELALVETYIDGLTFDFSRADAAGLDRDSLSLGPLGEEQSFAVTDAYRASTGGNCLGEPEGPDFCWSVQLAVVLPAETLPIQWPQTFTASAEDPGTRLAIEFLFFNRDPAKGQTGLMSGKIAIDQLTVGQAAPRAVQPQAHGLSVD